MKMMGDLQINDIDFIIQLLTKYKEEHAARIDAELEAGRLLEELHIKNQIIGELDPKEDYLDEILKHPDPVTITQIAQDYDVSDTEMNQILDVMGIQIKEKDGQWLLDYAYRGLGYTYSEPINITQSDGRSGIKMNTKWTQKGRLFLYFELKKEGILPLIEQEDEDE